MDVSVAIAVTIVTFIYDVMLDDLKKILQEPEVAPSRSI